MKTQEEIEADAIRDFEAAMKGLGIEMDDLGASYRFDRLTTYGRFDRLTTYGRFASLSRSDEPSETFRTVRNGRAVVRPIIERAVKLREFS